MSQDECGKTTVLEKNLNQALLDLHALDSAHTDTHILVTSYRATS